jgi:transcriptional regulator with XRE-family HTH domain
MAQRIKRAREAAGYTQAELGDKICMGTKNISAIECGRRGPSISVLKQLCEILHVSSDHLLFGGPEPIVSEDMALCLELLRHMRPQHHEMAKTMLITLSNALAWNERVEDDGIHYEVV